MAGGRIAVQWARVLIDFVVGAVADGGSLTASVRAVNGSVTLGIDTFGGVVGIVPAFLGARSEEG